MNKANYLELKKKSRDAATTFKREKTCFKCFRIEEVCLCHRIKPFDTETRFVILMHPKEAKKEKVGTGRICRTTLLNSEIIVGVDFTHHTEVNAIIQDPGNHCLTLYPGDKSLNISEHDVTPLIEAGKMGRRRVLFLIDGTWHCAKKMITQSLNIRSLPRLSFTATRESIFEIKEQPAAYCLSTLESIHVFLSEADRRGVEHLPGRPQDNLIDVFKFMIDFMLKCALDPAKSSYRSRSTGYSRRVNRIRRKKASGRGVVLKD